MPNRLQLEKSPYLRQHADNPVDWYPWGEEAFEKARRENKPVFLSIGYATSPLFQHLICIRGILPTLVIVFPCKIS